MYSLRVEKSTFVDKSGKTVEYNKFIATIKGVDVQVFINEHDKSLVKHLLSK